MKFCSLSYCGFVYFSSFLLQSSKVSLDHIESRLTKKKGAQFDVILQCTGSKDTITSLSNTLRQSNSITDIWIGHENVVQKKGNSHNFRPLHYLLYNKRLSQTMMTHISLGIKWPNLMGMRKSCPDRRQFF